MNALSKIGFSLVVPFVEPVKVSPLSAAVRAHRWCIARASQCEFGLLQSTRFECRLQVHRRARWQAHLRFRSVGIAVLGPVLPSSLHAAKVQLRVSVFHAMIGRLEVLQDELTCYTQFPLCLGVEDAAVNVG
jgi:hypothetical protein